MSIIHLLWMCSMFLDCHTSQTWKNFSPQQRELFLFRSWATCLTLLNLGTSHYTYLCALLLCSGNHVVFFHTHKFAFLFFTILSTETPTCLFLCLECLLVSFCLPGLSFYPTQMDRTIKSSLLPSVTTRTSRHNSVLSGPNTCQFWAYLQVSDSQYYAFAVKGVSTLPKIPAGYVTFNFFKLSV